MTMIDEIAKKMSKTNDSEYNKGLMLVKQYGYEAVKNEKAVQYWRACANV
jgi:hypothetical protein